MKILYAANNSYNSKIQLYRFYQSILNKNYNIKFAAYKKSSPNINIDYTLNCLLGVNNVNFNLKNENYYIYYDQIKNFAPDLIISDLEYFTSRAAIDLNIPLWQCSSSLINYALTHEAKYSIGTFKRFGHVVSRIPQNTQALLNIIDNSDLNLLYSHFCDTYNIPKIKNNFTWVRPYFTIDKKHFTCQHNIVAATPFSNKKIIEKLKKYQDCVIFTEFNQEYYDNLVIKNINNYEEYYCNLLNSNLFVCEGQTSFLADAFYNLKYSAVFPNFSEAECLINSAISENIGASILIFNSEDLNSYINKQVPLNLNEDVVFLHEMLKKA